jgi:hypothetical protein
VENQAEIRQIENENGKFTYLKLPERPAEIPEKFWNADNGLNLTALATGYGKLESGRAQYQDEVRNNLKAEFEAKLPKPPEVYKVARPTLEDAPAGFAFDAETDSFVSTLVAAGKDAGLTQEALDKLVTTRAKKAAEDFRTLGTQTREVLGEDYQQRISTVQSRLKDALGDEMASAISAAVSHPQAVVALEKLVGGSGAPGPGGYSGSEQLTEAKLKQMMNDPRYYDNYRRDPEYVKKVQQGFEQLYAGQKHDGEPRFTTG